MEDKYKKVFSYNIDINKTAYMNWRMSKYSKLNNMINVAKGYHNAALILTKDCIEDNIGKKADIVIFPIIFNANQAIELYLKSTMWSINILLGTKDTFVGKHDVWQIFTELKPKVEKFEKSNKTVENVEKFRSFTENLVEYLNEVKELAEYDDGKRKRDGMEFPRYPITVKKDNHFYVDTYDNVVVDMVNFFERFSEILENLNAIADYYYYLVEAKKDMENCN